MDRRRELCLDQPKPPLDARLRTLRRNRRSLRPSRNDSAHAQTLDKAKPLLMNLFFLDRLLMSAARPRAVRVTATELDLIGVSGCALSTMFEPQLLSKTSNNSTKCETEYIPHESTGQYH